MNSRAKFPIKI